MFAYCGNNPVARKDDKGEAFDTALDIVSLTTSVLDVVKNPTNPFAWGALAADVASLLLPGVTGGGALVRFVAKSDNILDAGKYADDVVSCAAKMLSDADTGKAMHNLYDPIKDTIDSSKKLVNKSLKRFNSRLRPDAVDFENRIIYELKPNNSLAFKKALKQAQRYAKTMGGDWTVVIDLYSK